VWRKAIETGKLFQSSAEDTVPGCQETDQAVVILYDNFKPLVSTAVVDL